MAKVPLISGFDDSLVGFTDALQRTLSVRSYRRFFEITSPYRPCVVLNTPNLANSNDPNQCHMNCKLAQEQGLGIAISGWYVMNEFIFEGFAPGMLRLIHHSNLLLQDGSLVNPTSDLGCTHHIFLRDDKRHYCFESRIGYNDRMVFADNFMVGQDHVRAVPRNKVLFASASEYDRDPYYECFKVYDSPEAVMQDLPKSLSLQEQRKWMTLKSTARVMQE